jgi:hypothetical protein
LPRLQGEMVRGLTQDDDRYCMSMNIDIALYKLYVACKEKGGQRAKSTASLGALDAVVSIGRASSLDPSPSHPLTSQAID